jgi:hypothetical protein
MDDAGAGNATTRNNQQHPKVKYIKLLQDIADRKVSDIVVELDDMEQVGISRHRCLGLANIPRSTKKLSGTKLEL